MEIRNRVIGIVSEASGRLVQDISDADKLADLGIDSLGIIELAMELEDEFELEIPDDEASWFKDVGDVVFYIESQVRSGGGKMPINLWKGIEL
jgi:acyl carrier protein